MDECSLEYRFRFRGLVSTAARALQTFHEHEEEDPYHAYVQRRSLVSLLQYVKGLVLIQG